MVMDLTEMIRQTSQVDLARSTKIFAMAEEICRPLRVTNKQLERLSNQIAEMARVRDCDTDRLRESVERLCYPMPETLISDTVLSLKIAGRNS